MAIRDIKDVPKSPNTSDMPTNIYNPLNVDFEFKSGGTPHTIPARSGGSFPEYMAYRAAKHLAEKIVAEQWTIKLNQEAINVPQDMKQAYFTKPIPQEDLRKMRDAILTGKEAFADVAEPETGLPILAEPVKEVPVEVPEVLEPPKDEPANEVPDYDKMSWQDLRKSAKEKGIFDKAMKKQDVISALKVRL